MANVFLNIPVPAANGSGAAVDVSSMGLSKTLSVAGPFVASVTIEITSELVPTQWAPLATFNTPDGVVLDAAARWMRATVAGYKSGTPAADVGSDDSGTTFASLPVTAGDGAGAAVDTSLLPLFKTATVGGPFKGNVQLEVSEDGVNNWSQLGFGFGNPGQQSQVMAAKWMRAVRAGVPVIAPGLPIVNIGACPTGGGGGGSATVFTDTTLKGDGSFADPLGTTVLISVKDFGATGDGTNNDRTAVQFAIDEAIGLPIGRARNVELFFPPGNYKCVGYLDFNGATNFVVRGAGATIIFSSDDTAIHADGIALSDAVARSGFFLRNCHDVDIRELSFSGGQHPNITSVNIGSAIYLRHCANVTVSRCKATGGYGLVNQDATADSSGTGDSLTVAAGVVTLVDAAGLFNPGHVGRELILAGTTNNENAGVFQITAFVDANTIEYQFAYAISEVSAFTWTINDADRNTHIIDCDSVDQRGPITLGSHSKVIGGSVKRPMTLDVCGIGDVFTVVGTTVTLTDKEGRFLPMHKDKIVTIANATTPANNGMFRITYISANQISWTNAAGVAEFFPGTWWIANGQKAGFGAGVGAISVAGTTVTFTADEPSFVASDLNAGIRIAFSSANGAFGITAVLSSTQVQWENNAAISEDFSGPWTVDSFDRVQAGGEACGSTHGFYIFAGRTDILIDGVTIEGVRTAAVKGSGSSQPTRAMHMVNCYVNECGCLFEGGADDTQEHTAFVCENNIGIDIATNRPGASTALGISILGSRGARVLNNEFYYTRNSTATVDGRGNAGHMGIQANGGGLNGDTQPLEDLVVEGNEFDVNPAATTQGGILIYGINVAACGLRSQFSASGTLTKSGNTMTLFDGLQFFSPDVINKYLRIYGAPDAGNNGDFNVAEWVDAHTIRFTNAAGVGGAVSAGVYAIARGVGGTFQQSFSGSCKISNNEIHSVAGVAIATTSCVAPQVTNNGFSNALITTNGDVMPYIVDNTMLATNTESAIIRIFPQTSWPIIHGNKSSTRNIGASPGSDPLIGDNTGDILDWPLLGTRGLAVPTMDHAECVFAYGTGHIDGDYVSINGGAFFYYKAVAPGAGQFNSFAGLLTLINAFGGGIFTATDYGHAFPFPIDTYHIKVKLTATSATPNEFSISTYSVNATALMSMYNKFPRVNRECDARGEGAAQDKTVVWSPLCAYSGTISVVAENAPARLLLTSGYYCENNFIDTGCDDVVNHSTAAGTEILRWVISA